MLARKQAPAERDRTAWFSHAVRELFGLWRHALGRGLCLVREGSGSPVALVRRFGQTVRTSLLEPASTEAQPTRTLVLAGMMAFAVGAAGMVILGRHALAQTVSGAAIMALWCAARLPLMMIAAEAKSRVDRRAVTRAWALGLLPYIFAVLPLLQFLAWIVSAGLALRSLDASGFQRRRTIWCLAWGYGSQALAVVAAWLTKNAFIAGAVLKR